MRLRRREGLLKESKRGGRRRVKVFPLSSTKGGGNHNFLKKGGREPSKIEGGDEVIVLQWSRKKQK